MNDAGFGFFTERLTLRRFTAEDLDFLDSLHRDPEVMRHMGGLKPRGESEELLFERILPYYAQHPGLGIWITIERQTGAQIGVHLINHLRGEPHIQVGYLLHAAYWNQGYGTEMCSALVRYGFANLGIPQIVAITTLDNLASQRVLLKSGLQRKGERNFPAYAKYGPQAYFERDAADWLAVNGRAAP